MKKKFLFIVAAISLVLTIAMIAMWSKDGFQYLLQITRWHPDTPRYITVYSLICMVVSLIYWHALAKPVATIIIDGSNKERRRVEISARNKKDYDMIWMKYKEFIREQHITRDGGAVIEGDNTYAEWFTIEDTERIKNFFSLQNVVIKEVKS